jgi:hypothetical protein
VLISRAAAEPPFTVTATSIHITEDTGQSDVGAGAPLRPTVVIKSGREVKIEIFRVGRGISWFMVGEI